MEQDQLIRKMTDACGWLHPLPDGSDKCDKRFGITFRVHQFVLIGHDKPFQQEFGTVRLVREDGLYGRWDIHYFDDILNNGNKILCVSIRKLVLLL